MISGGIATVVVSSMDRAYDFYTRVLGLRSLCRYGDHWAEVEAGANLRIGLHPAGPDLRPGARGSISIGLDVSAPIEEEVSRLKSLGAAFHGPVLDRPEEGIKLAFFSDPDGNALYLCEQMRRG